MPNVVEEVPIELKPAVDAALAWINQERSARFKITGLVDPGEAMDQEPGRPIELGLVLCDGDECRCEHVRLNEKGQGFEVSAIEAETPVIPPHLDPPSGVRRSWLDDQLGKHAFIVLLFYRGLW